MSNGNCNDNKLNTLSNNSKVKYPLADILNWERVAKL